MEDTTTENAQPCLVAKRNRGAKSLLLQRQTLGDNVGTMEHSLEEQRQTTEEMLSHGQPMKHIVHTERGKFRKSPNGPSAGPNQVSPGPWGRSKGIEQQWSIHTSDEDVDKDHDHII